MTGKHTTYRVDFKAKKIIYTESGEYTKPAPIKPLGCCALVTDYQGVWCYSCQKFDFNNCLWIIK